MQDKIRENTEFFSMGWLLKSSNYSLNGLIILNAIVLFAIGLIIFQGILWQYSNQQPVAPFHPIFYIAFICCFITLVAICLFKTMLGMALRIKLLEERLEATEEQLAE